MVTVTNNSANIIAIPEAYKPGSFEFAPQTKVLRPDASIEMSAEEWSTFAANPAVKQLITERILEVEGAAEEAGSSFKAKRMTKGE